MPSRLAISLALCLLLAPAARAQVALGTSVTPENFDYHKPHKHERLPVIPFAIATTLAFDTTAWAKISISTSATPAQEITRLVQHGYYKQELLQLILLSQRAATPMTQLLDERSKGATLRQLAQKRQADYYQLYEDALALDDRIQLLLPKVLEISTDYNKS